jgi:hypothetical protein
MTIYDEFLHFGMRACPKDMGCVVNRRVAYRADRATSIGADAGLCAVGQRALSGTGGCPELVDTNLKDMADGCEETG